MAPLYATTPRRFNVQASGPPAGLLRFASLRDLSCPGASSRPLRIFEISHRKSSIPSAPACEAFEISHLKFAIASTSWRKGIEISNLKSQIPLATSVGGVLKFPISNLQLPLP
ncbi:MAG TPA: hypothetical protein VNO70_03565, partial [Blastocatellia bacterium]|nr:hypothetical protein [Blastocatellia bacterium]